MINKVTLIGNLGSDADTKVLENSKVTKLSVATSDDYKDKGGNWANVTDWHNVVVWNSDSAEALKKGMQVYVEGKIKTRKYQDSEGKDRYTTEIVGKVRRLGKKEGSSNNFPSAQDAPNDGFYDPSRD